MKLSLSKIEFYATIRVWAFHFLWKWFYWVFKHKSVFTDRTSQFCMMTWFLVYSPSHFIAIISQTKVRQFSRLSVRHKNIEQKREPLLDEVNLQELDSLHLKYLARLNVKVTL